MSVWKESFAGDGPLSPLGVGITLTGLCLLVLAPVGIALLPDRSTYVTSAFASSVIVVAFFIRWIGAAVSLRPARNGWHFSPSVQRGLVWGGAAIGLLSLALALILQSLIPSILAAVILTAAAILVVPLGHRVIRRGVLRSPPEPVPASPVSLD